MSTGPERDSHDRPAGRKDVSCVCTVPSPGVTEDGIPTPSALSPVIAASPWSPMVIKTEMIKTCPAPRYGSTPVHEHFSRSSRNVSYLVLFFDDRSIAGRLNNGINDASSALVLADFLRDRRRKSGRGSSRSRLFTFGPPYFEICAYTTD